MAKTAKAPQGLYSATEAIRKLKVPKSTFYDMVDKGTVKKVTLPGRSDSYYLKAAIDSLAKARDLFTTQYVTDAPSFSKATEDDVKGIYEVALSLWGTRGTYPYELRLARYRKNPEIYYVLKYLDIVVGFSTLMPISTRSVEEIMQTGKPGYEAIKLEDILSFSTVEPIEYLFLEIAVRDDVPKPKQYAMHLISSTSNEIDNFARKGVTFKKLWAMSRTGDGIGISRKLGFKETPLPPDGKTLAFELETETANNFLIRDYKSIVLDRVKQSRKD